MNKYLVKELLISNNYWVLNKTAVKIFGLETAFLLSNFAEAETMLADKEGWFYQTGETVEKMTTLSRHKQDQCIKELEDAGVLIKKVKGMPAKRYFKLDYDRLTNLFANFLQTGLLNSNKLDCKKLTTSKELINKELINKELTSTLVETNSTPPNEKDAIPYKEIINYLNDKAQRNYRNVESNNKHIRARFNEGYKLEDFKSVIDIKCSQWLGDEKMKGFLRPSTLFGTKFDNYLNEELKKPTGKQDTRDYNGVKLKGNQTTVDYNKLFEDAIKKQREGEL